MTSQSARWKGFKRVVLSQGLFLCLAGFFVCPGQLCAQAQKTVWSDSEKPIAEAVRTLGKVPEDQRAQTAKQLALQIRQLPAGLNKVRLANSLAHQSTEGDLGRDTLQEVGTTLAGSVREHPVSSVQNGPAAPYVELAKLVRYEHVQVSVDDPQFAAAMTKIEADDLRRQQADFVLADLHGKKWALKDLRGYGSVGELLGYLVLTLPQRNARPRSALRTVQE
jgi:hypothetical protein